MVILKSNGEIQKAISRNILWHPEQFWHYKSKSYIGIPTHYSNFVLEIRIIPQRLQNLRGSKQWTQSIILEKMVRGLTIPMNHWDQKIKEGGNGSGLLVLLVFVIAVLLIFLNHLPTGGGVSIVMYSSNKCKGIHFRKLLKQWLIDIARSQKYFHSNLLCQIRLAYHRNNWPLENKPKRSQ